MRKKKYYLRPEDIDNKKKRIELYNDNFKKSIKKLSIDNTNDVCQFILVKDELNHYIHFQFKKDTEAFHLAYCLNEKFSKMDKNVYKKGNKLNYDCVNIETPWFNVFDMWYKLRKKYYKGQAFEDEREYLKTNWFFRAFKWPEEKDVEANVAPNYNPVYKWKFGWEYSLDPMSYRNLKSFMKARIVKIKELRGTVLEEKINQMKLQKVKKEFEEEQKIKTEKFEKQEKIKKMQAKRYQPLDTVVRDPGVYIICEEKKSLTKVKNKINCLYIGESQVLAKRLSSYSNINKKNHELVDKISRKLKKPREEILEKLKDNIKVRTLKFKRMENSEERKRIEGYLINRLKPLANTSKNN